LAISEKVLGTEHPSTATTYNNIALVYSYQGDYAKALEWYSRSYRIVLRVLGYSHPHARTIRSNMEYVYAKAGHLDSFDSFMSAFSYDSDNS